MPFNVDGFVRLSELDVERRRVFVRADLDCPLDAEGQVQSDAKLCAALPTLRTLLDQEAQVVVGTHLSSSEGGVPRSIEPCAARLCELLEAEIYLPDESTGLLPRKLANELRPGRLVVLENLLRDPREADGDESLGRALARGIEVYVGDCLAGPHELASIAKMPQLVHERAIGVRFEAELVAANRLRHAWGKGMVLVVAGAFRERRGLLEQAIEQPGVVVCAAGELGRTVNDARQQGESRDADATLLAEARTWLAKAARRGVTVEVDEAVFAKLLERARATLFVGSAPSFSTLLDAARRGSGFITLVESGPLLDTSSFERSGFVSTAGEAFIGLLCEHKLAGVEALRRR
jgi:3-phosphoglycerate kinase